MTINARAEEDVEPECIMQKVARASGANYAFHKESGRFQDTGPQAPVVSAAGPVTSRVPGLALGALSLGGLGPHLPGFWSWSWIGLQMVALCLMGAGLPPGGQGTWSWAQGVALDPAWPFSQLAVLEPLLLALCGQRFSAGNLHPLPRPRHQHVLCGPAWWLLWRDLKGWTGQACGQVPAACGPVLDGD